MKKLLLSIFAIGALLGLIAIVGWQYRQGGITASITGDRPITVATMMYPGYAPWFIAKDKGFFEEEGVPANVVMISDFLQLIPSFVSGAVDVLPSTADLSVVVAETGTDFKQILAGDEGFGSDGLLAKNDAQNFQDLRGKSVYLAPGSPSHFVFRYLQKDAGIPFENITLERMEPDQVGAAFAAGQIDYGVSWEPWLTKASQERADGRVLFSTRDTPGIIVDTMVVRGEVLRSRPDDVQALLRAWFRSIDFLRTNEDEAVAIMAKGMGLPPQELREQLKNLRFLSFDQSVAKFDKTQPLNLYDLTDAASDIFMADKVIAKPADADAINDGSFLRAINDR